MRVLVLLVAGAFLLFLGLALAETAWGDLLFCELFYKSRLGARSLGPITPAPYLGQNSMGCMGYIPASILRAVWQ
jgi:hypothetical protein